MSRTRVNSIGIADGQVQTADIADSNVTTAKIADGNVTTSKIADGNVTTSKIADGNVTAAKIADGNVTTAKIADSNITTSKIADGNVTTAKIADSNVTAAKLADDVSSYLAFPIGGIVIWSGTVAQIPAGWYLCDGGTYGGIKTPDLRNRFIIGAAETGTGTADSPNAGPGFDATTGVIASNYKIHNVGGETAHQLTIAELASHTHPYNHFNCCAGSNYDNLHGFRTGGGNTYNAPDFPGVNTDPTGGDKYHENRPPYYALAYIMKCELKAGTTQNITTTTPTLQELRLNGPLYDQEMDGGAQKGNAGDVLTSLGDGNGVRWESGAKSLTSNGYQRLPGGLIMQWGIISGSATSVTFPIVFPNSLLSLQVSWYNSNPGNAYSQYLGCTGSSTSSFTCVTAGVSRSWMAIGY